MQESILPETGFTLIPFGNSGVSKSCSYVEATGWTSLLIYQLVVGWDFKRGHVGGHNLPGEAVPFGDSAGYGAAVSYYQATLTVAGE